MGEFGSKGDIKEEGKEIDDGKQEGSDDSAPNFEGGGEEEEELEQQQQEQPGIYGDMPQYQMPMQGDMAYMQQQPKYMG